MIVGRADCQGSHRALVLRNVLHRTIKSARARYDAGQSCVYRIYQSLSIRGELAVASLLQYLRADALVGRTYWIVAETRMKMWARNDAIVGGGGADVVRYAV